MAENISSVTDVSFQAEVIEASNSQPVMVDFWADWCRPCHMLAPTVAEIAQTYAGKLKVVKLNVDENVNSAGRYNIRGIPTLLIFKGGQVADQIVGAVPKEQISKIVDRHLNYPAGALPPRAVRRVPDLFTLSLEGLVLLALRGAETSRRARPESRRELAKSRFQGCVF